MKDVKNNLLSYTLRTIAYHPYILLSYIYKNIFKLFIFFMFNTILCLLASPNNIEIPK